MPLSWTQIKDHIYKLMFKLKIHNQCSLPLAIQKSMHNIQVQPPQVTTFLQVLKNNITNGYTDSRNTQPIQDISIYTFCTCIIRRCFQDSVHSKVLDIRTDQYKGGLLLNPRWGLLLNPKILDLT